MKATEQFIPVVLFITLYKVALIFSIWFPGISIEISYWADHEL